MSNSCSINMSNGSEVDYHNYVENINQVFNIINPDSAAISINYSNSVANNCETELMS